VFFHWNLPAAALALRGGNAPEKAALLERTEYVWFMGHSSVECIRFLVIRRTIEPATSVPPMM
jgi:hypothetical protein